MPLRGSRFSSCIHCKTIARLCHYFKCIMPLSHNRDALHCSSRPIADLLRAIDIVLLMASMRWIKVIFTLSEIRASSYSNRHTAHALAHEAWASHTRYCTDACGSSKQWYRRASRCHQPAISMPHHQGDIYHRLGRRFHITSDALVSCLLRHIRICIAAARNEIAACQF